MKKLFLFALILLIFSCDPPKPHVRDLIMIKQMDWLIGSWEHLSEEGNLYETWVEENDSTYAGKSYMTVKGDTVSSEKVRLELRNDNLSYVAIVSDQNSNQAVSFKFTSVNNGEIIFENKTHDFPQRVVYKNPHPDSLYARIEGTENGKTRQEEFSMAKKK